MTIDHIIAICFFSRHIWWSTLTVLVGAMEIEMPWREKEGRRHPLRARSMGVMKRKECKIIPERNGHQRTTSRQDQANRRP
jgi:hypothetical protein